MRRREDGVEAVGLGRAREIESSRRSDSIISEIPSRRRKPEATHRVFPVVRARKDRASASASASGLVWRITSQDVFL